MREIKVGDFIRRTNWVCDLEVNTISTTHYQLKASAGALFWYAKGGTWIVNEDPPSKPWLKVTPPTPERRELQSCFLARGIQIEFSKDLAMAYLCDRVSALDKSKLKTLGETLIEISKEMK